jgi:hypothetical protein
MLKKSLPPSLRGAKRRCNPESGREQSENGCVSRETSRLIASLRSQRWERLPFFSSLIERIRRNARFAGKRD